MFLSRDAFFKQLVLSHVSFTAKMQYTKFPKGKIVKKGGNAKLDCVVKAYPVPNQAWKKDGELVTNDSRHFVTRTELTIKQFDRSDMGNYACVAWNPISAQVREALLIMTGNNLI